MGRSGAFYDHSNDLGEKLKMVLVNETSIFATTFTAWTTNVFGSSAITAMMILFVILIITILLKISLPICFMMMIPLTLIMMAIGWLTLIIGGSVIIIFMVLEGMTWASTIQ